MRSVGFTLIELIVVVAIIGILAVTVVLNIDGVPDDAKVSAIRADLKTLATFASVFRLAHGRYPESIEEMLDPPESASGPNTFLDEMPIDPYSLEPYLYEVDDKGALFISFGRDLAPGGEGYDADLTSRRRSR
ncbi:MAG: type II secretion system protein GspG [Planctomycetes bacterium]|nr:type II secretion system protein GspG [Planctomycetota bacterium]